jgi:pimeloyl-ACP methyl ester carboxylesterase
MTARRAKRDRRRLVSPAVLCIALALLLATSATGVANGGGNSHQPPACFDGTPHDEMLVRADKNARLSVLDWGGQKKPRTMVLLTGLGDNAHVYDQFAYQFTEFFHVIGITRRGFLPSDQPRPRPGQPGYDVDSRARDDIAILDALGIDKAVFVGHSVAGSELSALGAKYGDRVEALVYLDAFDLSKRFQLPDIPPPPYSDADAKSLQLQQAAQARLEDILRPLQEICLTATFDKRGAITGSTTPEGVLGAILQGVQAVPPTDWSGIAAPRLGIFNQPTVDGRLPYYAYLSAGDKLTFDANWPAIVQWYADRIEEFAAARPGKPEPVVHRLTDAPHYFYINDQAFVIEAMRQFLLGSPPP